MRSAMVRGSSTSKPETRNTAKSPGLRGSIARSNANGAAAQFFATLVSNTFELPLLVAGLGGCAHPNAMAAKETTANAAKVRVIMPRRYMVCERLEKKSD